MSIGPEGVKDKGQILEAVLANFYFILRVMGTNCRIFKVLE